MNVIGPQKVVTITYELRDGSANGALLERMDANYPFIFLFGSGKLLPSFEAQLAGLTPEDSFEFILPCSQAYGPSNPLNIIELARRIFEQNGEIPQDYITEGHLVSVTDDEGMVHNGKILSFNETHVTIDFNHAMANKDLHFKGAILDIRDATIDELVRNHYIQEDGIHGWEYGEPES